MKTILIALLLNFSGTAAAQYYGISPSTAGVRLQVVGAVDVYQSSYTTTGPNIVLHGPYKRITARDGAQVTTMSAAGFYGPLTGNVTGNVSGNAGTVTNGVYTSGSYADPAWLTSLATAKVDLSTVTAALDEKVAKAGDDMTGQLGIEVNSNTAASLLVMASTASYTGWPSYGAAGAHIGIDSYARSVAGSPNRYGQAIRGTCFGTATCTGGYFSAEGSASNVALSATAAGGTSNKAGSFTGDVSIDGALGVTGGISAATAAITAELSAGDISATSLTTSGQIIAAGTMTVQGNAFSVGGSSFAVNNGDMYFRKYGKFYLTETGGTGFRMFVPDTGSYQGLTIQGDGNNIGNARFANGGVGIGITYSAPTVLIPTHGLIVTGNTGLGTSTPDQRLTVAGNISTTGNIISSGPGSNYFGAMLTSTTVSGQLSLDARSNVTTTGDFNYTVLLSNMESYAINQGPGIAFAPAYVGGNSGGRSSGIGGVKENATAGNYAGALVFATRPNGGAMAERARISSAGDMGVGTKTPTARLHVSSGPIRNDGTDAGIVTTGTMTPAVYTAAQIVLTAPAALYGYATCSDCTNGGTAVPPILCTSTSTAAGGWKAVTTLSSLAGCYP